MSDNVNHPEHYTQGGIECIDAIKASMTREEFVGYLKGNCLKYLWRYRNKGKAQEDLKKAQWYLDKLVKEWECTNTVIDGSHSYWPMPKSEMLSNYIDSTRFEGGFDA